MILPKPAASTSVVDGSERDWLELARGLQTIGRRLAGAAVGDDFIGDLLAFIETGQTSAFNRTDVNENIWPAGIRLNETKTLLGIKPLYDACLHSNSFQDATK